MNLYLVRHAQSTINAGGEWGNCPDKEVPLTEKGKKQAQEVARFFIPLVKDEKTILFSSPYVRAFETAKEISKGLSLPIITDPRLEEFHPGLFGNFSFDECERKFPLLFKKFKEDLASDKKFYAKGPDGESAYDVTLRLAPFKKILQDLCLKGYQNVIVVTHSGCMRAFIALLMNYDTKWYANEGNMKNTSTRLLKIDLDKIVDKGYVYLGYKHSPKKDNNDAEISY